MSDLADEPLSPTRLAAHAPGGVRHSPEAERRREARLLAVLVAGLVAIGSLPLMAPGATVDWRGQWVFALLVAATAVFGAFQIYGQDEPRGVPVESLITPGLVATAVYAAVPAAVWLGVHPVFALAAVIGAGAIVVRTAIDAELPFVRLGGLPSAGDRRIVESLLLGTAFLVFIGVAATLPGGWPLPELNRPGAALVDSVVVLGLADAGVGFFVGYRLTAMAGPVPAVGWASGTYAVLIGVAAVFFRWLAIPGLMGPALLAVVLYLRSVVRTRGVSPDRATTRWPLEAFVLAAVVLAVVVYQLLGR
jgi:hypothetical protein